MSIKSTPEVDLNSLQVDQPQVPTILSPKPVIDDPLIPTSTSSIEPPSIPPATMTSTPQVQPNTNPDETIQQIVTNPDSPSKSPQVQAVKQEPLLQEFSVPPSTTTPTTTKLHLPSGNPPVTNTQPSSTPEPALKTEAIALVPGTVRAPTPDVRSDSAQSTAKVSAYARLEFENFIFYVQTLQVILGRKSENDQSHSVDVHLGASKAISRKHAKIFYNFGTERFELSIQGKNGAFVDDNFIERGATVPLTNKSKIQIGQIVFRFVLPGADPQQKGESPSKPLNPSDAVTLKSALYANQGGSDGLDGSGKNTPHLTSMDFAPVNGQAASVSSAPQQPSAGIVAADSLAKKPVKEKKTTRVPKPPKKVYTLEEIPEEYRTKPNCSYSNLIATCLRTHGTPKGMSLAEIYKSIRDIFPYYKYCPDGWQSSVRHNLSLNKAFRKVSKEGKGWLWGLDEEYCAEKEKAKKKQQAAAAAKAKAAALKIEQQQQQQQKQQQPQVVSSVPLDAQQRVNIAIQSPQTLQPQSQLQQSTIQLQNSGLGQPQQTHLQQTQPTPNVPLYANNSNSSTTNQQITQDKAAQTITGQQSKTPSIQAQLAANRGVTPQGQRTTPPTSTQQRPNPLGADTKKALAHLQQQLVLLSKDLRNLVDKPTISAILTQAIAMTIAQVTQAAKAKGITSDPLATLIETNPQQLTKILTVALNAATYKVTNGRIKAPLSVTPSAPASRAATPVSTPPVQKAQPFIQQHQGQSPATNQAPQNNPQPKGPLPGQTAPSSLNTAQHHVPSHGQQQLMTPSQAPSSAPYPQPPQAQQAPAKTATPTPQQPPSTNSEHATSTPALPAVSQATSVPPAAQGVPKAAASSSRESSLPSPQVPHPQSVPAVSAQSTPFPERSVSPRAATPSQPLSSENAQVQAQSTQVSAAKAPVRETPKLDTTTTASPVTADTSSTPAPVTAPVTAPGLAPESAPASEPPQPSLVQTSAEKKEVKQEASQPDLSFLNDDLDDPEFNKVLESLSKEGTPGLEGDASATVMDDEELNRLLAQDFTESTSSGTGGPKRGFDEVDTSALLEGEDASNKMQKTE